MLTLRIIILITIIQTPKTRQKLYMPFHSFLNMRGDIGVDIGVHAVIHTECGVRRVLPHYRRKEAVLLP
jgi:hypothetical protein